jgi:glycosyltransferase involved in cell wall biosynthesis
MTKCRILFVVNNLKVGGAERYVVDVLKRLDRTRFEIMLVSLGKGNGFGDEIFVPLVEIGMEKNSRNVLKIISFMNVLRKFRPHIIHTHLRYADMLGQMFGRMFDVPAIITTIHGIVEWRRERRTLFTTIEDKVVQYAQMVIAVSERTRDYIVAERNVAPERIRILPCGIDIEPFTRERNDREELRCKLEVDTETIVFACTAQFRPEKRHDILLSAFAKLLQQDNVKAKLLLIGNGGVLQEQVAQQIKDMGMSQHVMICGGDREYVAGLLSASDIFTMYSESEGTSLALAEAMASGLPLLIPDLSHFTHQAKNKEHGSFFVFGDADSYVRSAMELVRDKALRTQYGDQARSYAVQTYGMEKHIHSLTAIYDGLVSKYVFKKHPAL